MAIKVGFSSMACPAWNLQTMVEQAAALGYDGFELRGLGGEFHLPESAELTDDPTRVRTLIKDAGLELVSLGSSASFESPDKTVRAGSRRDLSATIELANRLECPYIRINLGTSQGAEHRGTLARVAGELSELAPQAGRSGVTILVENCGDFVTSEDLWFVVDAVGHPAVRVCWNPLNAMLRREKPTVSIPRLARWLDVLRLTDGAFDEQGRFAGYRLPGEGDVDMARAIDVLKGVCFQGWLIFEWPKMIANLPEPAEALPEVVTFARQRLAEVQPVLSAYKGDKHPTRFEAPLAVEAPSEA
ncbi:MAG: sugar phosphate isomerase/epimerase [bacterium]|nr:sugar phosphate isomerase/epimerase [bacterium]